MKQEEVNEQVKNEEREAVEQPVSEEQPKTDEEEEVGEDLKEMLDVCEKKHRRQYLLEKAMLCVVVMIAASMVGWLVCGKWLNAVNNLLWLFIAWMYWRQQKAMVSAAGFILHLLAKTFNLTEQIANLEKMNANLKKIDDLRQQIINKQDKLIEHLQEQ